jgi:ethanolamine transporter EutH
MSEIDLWVSSRTEEGRRNRLRMNEFRDWLPMLKRTKLDFKIFKGDPDLSGFMTIPISCLLKVLLLKLLNLPLQVALFLKLSILEFHKIILLQTLIDWLCLLTCII